jgi:type I thyroxine 5'-deiodinase
MYQKYKEQAAFFVVYIYEAHASDAWQVMANRKDEVLIQTPKSFDERLEVAGSCVRKLGIELPALVDDLQNATEAAYTGWPDRLYVIDREGRVAYKSAPGPWGFRPREMEAALQKAL